MIEYTPTIPDFNLKEGLNEELQVKGIYLRSKLVKKQITATGDVSIICGFPPKLVLASCQDSGDSSEGSYDLSLSFSIRKYNNLGTFSTSESTNLVNMGSMVANVDRLLSNGFILDVSSFSGGNKNIYFNCFS